MPALLMRIVTPPKASTAVLITAAPSVTDDVLATAFPPAKTRSITGNPQASERKKTFDNLINNFLRRCCVEVVHDNVGTTGSKEEGVAEK